MDENGDGSITLPEFLDGCKNVKIKLNYLLIQYLLSYRISYDSLAET